MKTGLLISVEGPDGAGKSSVLTALLPRLKARYEKDILLTREPGGVRIAEAIREVILDVEHTEMDAKTELLLYIAARRQHMVERILPALDEGKLVFVDRFIDSSVVYQGFGRGLDKDAISWLNAYATDGVEPDVTLLFDVPSEVGLERIAKGTDREINRLDKEGLSLHQRVREGYLTLAKEKPRIHVIDANREFDSVVEEAFELITGYIEELL